MFPVANVLVNRDL